MTVDGTRYLTVPECCSGKNSAIMFWILLDTIHFGHRPGLVISCFGHDRCWLKGNPWSTILHRVVIHPGVVRVQEACADVLKHLANGIFQERIGHNVGNAASKKGTLEMVVLLESLSGSPLNYGEPQIAHIPVYVLIQRRQPEPRSQLPTLPCLNCSHIGAHVLDAS